MENLLAEKQAEIDSKEADLKALKTRLEQIETGLVTPEEVVTPTTSTKEEHDSDESKVAEENEHQAKTEALSNEIEQLKQHIQELEQARDEQLEKSKEAAAQFEEEKAELIKKQEEAEEILRENMEKVREKLEAEKQDLHDRIKEKEAEVSKLKKDMDELRESVQV